VFRCSVGRSVAHSRRTGLVSHLAVYYQEIDIVELNDPEGWITIPLVDPEGA